LFSKCSPMHTALIIALGFALLGATAAAGRLLGGTHGLERGLLVFLPLWLIGAGVNMYIGVTRAGYSVADETPVFLVVFAVPAAAALGLWWKLR
jgi:hypothetical protein